MLDQFSRYVCAVALPDKSAKTVSAAIMVSWISLYGAPQTIRMDQGSEFNNYLLKSMLEGMDVNIKVGYAHNHQSNPIVGSRMEGSEYIEEGGVGWRKWSRM